MLFEILSKRVELFAADLRLGTRLVLRRWTRIERSTRSRLELAAVFSLLPISAAIAAIAAVPTLLQLDAVEPRLIAETIELPLPEIDARTPAQSHEYFVREARVQRGDTAASLLLRLGVSDDAALRFIVSQPTARSLLRLAPGRFVQGNLDADGRLEWLRVYSENFAEGDWSSRVVTMTRSTDEPGGFRIAEQDVALERQIELRTGVVQTSLSGAADGAGVPDSVAKQMVDVLEGQIDFNRALQPGVRFSVVYESMHTGGEFLRPGRLLALEFVAEGQRVQAYWFPDGGARGGYYGADGASMQLAFLRSPLEYSRVNSNFGGNRSHPMFGYVAAHKGVDLQAPAGAKVRSIAAGVVEFAGWQNGYGNVVEIRHDARHSTLYAHLQAFGPGLVKGARIAQGGLVGLVGSTGWATGPNLHYELKVQGKVVNPLTAKLPGATPLPSHLEPALAVAIAPLREHLSLLDRIHVASAP